jgi:hypothetical protein
MKRFSISAALLLLTWISVAFAMVSQYARQHPYRGFTRDKYVDVVRKYIPGISALTEQSYDPELPPEFVADTPIWDFTSANPPLSVQMAIERAEQFRRDHLQKVDINRKWGLKSISLLPLIGAEAKWCWCVEYRTVNNLQNKNDKSVRVLIRMDGFVQEPFVFDEK